MEGSRIRPLWVLWIPLALGGCGLPVGVQIASLLADGISFFATEKTVSDHGISLVADKDCAVWRAVKGDDICRQQADGDTAVAVASEPTEPEPPAEALAELDVAAGASEPAPPAPPIVPSPPVTVEILPAPAPARDGAPAAKPAAIDPAPTAAGLGEAEVKIQPLPPAVETPAPGGTFWVIASFYRPGDAKRFARRVATIPTKVLAGTARGRIVFRVAVGPVAKTKRSGMRRRLARAGFSDAWALKLKRPRVVVELASAE